MALKARVVAEPDSVKRTTSMPKINIAIVGVGNCASALVQGIHYYKGKQAGEITGLMHWDVGGYTPGDIQVVAAFDIGNVWV